MGKTIPLQDQSNILARKINFQMTLEYPSKTTAAFSFFSFLKQAP